MPGSCVIVQSRTEVLYMIRSDLSAWGREASAKTGARFRDWLGIMQSAGTCSVPSVKYSCFE